MNIHLEKELPCNGQCEQECTGHKMTLDYHSVSNIIALDIDGDILILDIDEIRVLKDIIEELFNK